MTESKRRVYFPCATIGRKRVHDESRETQTSGSSVSNWTIEVLTDLSKLPLSHKFWFAACSPNCRTCSYDETLSKSTCTATGCALQYTWKNADKLCYCEYAPPDGKISKMKTFSKIRLRPCSPPANQRWVFLSSACPNNCKQCSYNTAGTATVCDLNKCLVKFAQKPSDYTCHGQYLLCRC